MTALVCSPWNSSTETRALAFLKERFGTCMFLLSNRESHGVKLGEHQSSGNFQVLLEGSRVCAVFALFRRGNLILSGDLLPGAASLIVQSARAEGLELKGVLGSWELAEAVWKELATPTCSFHSKEILFQLSPIPVAAPEASVRFLTDSDWAEWRPIRRAYQKEEGILHEIPEEQLRANFARYTGDREFWGFFENGQLISTAALNARALDIGQVGGVYTVPSRRGKGLSQSVMRQLLSESAQVHGLHKMILFTGDKNAPAQRVYEKLGFQRIGHYGIFFV